ncbi:MAG: hypothetical protein ABSC10_21905 [Candidatus Acidiferrales bacterium]|jgi:hemoglobin
MIRPEQSRSLAHEIGICRIAMVIDQMHVQLRTHRTLGELSYGTADWGSERARLTYFWWVALGGQRLRTADCDLIPGRVRASLTPELLEDWLTLFRRAALPMIGAQLTDAWMSRTERLGRKFLCDRGEALAKLAQAS